MSLSGFGVLCWLHKMNWGMLPPRYSLRICGRLVFFLPQMFEENKNKGEIEY